MIVTEPKEYWVNTPAKSYCKVWKIYLSIVIYMYFHMWYFTPCGHVMKKFYMCVLHTHMKHPNI